MGNIFDEFDDEEIEFRKIKDHTYEVSGMISLDDLEDLIDLDLPVDDYETFSGFLIGLIGSIPSQGDVIDLEYQHLRISILEVSAKRIEKAVIYINDEDSDNGNG
nr:transporter associated domain-containing protein [uncultured Acetobacterium sp.]